jgi:WhiB family redox-sensing transcriptional regulator
MDLFCQKDLFLTASPFTDTSYRSVETTDRIHEWRDRAECRGLENAMFFPLSDDPAATSPAKKVCATCPVQDECLSFALETGQPAGIWGGLTTTERRRLLVRLYKQGWSRTQLPGPSQLGTMQKWKPEAS